MESIVITKNNVKPTATGGLDIDGKVVLPKSTVHAFIRWTYAVSHTNDDWPLCVGQYSLYLDKEVAVSLRKELRKSMLIDDRTSCKTFEVGNYLNVAGTVYDWARRDENPVTLVLNILNYSLVVWYRVNYPKEWEVSHELIQRALAVYEPGWSDLVTVDAIRNPNNSSSKISYELA